MNSESATHYTLAYVINMTADRVDMTLNLMNCGERINGKTSLSVFPVSPGESPVIPPVCLAFERKAKKKKKEEAK